MMLIDDILNTDTSINAWYRESRLPKHIKKYIAHGKRKKLRKATLKYNGLVLDYNDVMSFLSVCLRLNPPDGAYMYIRKIAEYYSRGQAQYAISMSTDSKSNNRINYTIYMGNVREGIMDIKATIVSDKGSRTINTSRSSLEIKDDSDDTTELVIDNCNDMFIHMIIMILNETFDRSERIYEE